MNFKTGRVRRIRASRLALALALVLLPMAFAACGSSDDTGTSAATGAESTESQAVADSATAEQLEAAEVATDLAFEGTFGEPPADPNPAAKGKTVWVISPGQASAPAALISEGAIKAAKVLGWDATLCDAKLDPAKQAECYKSAIASGADGIVGVATDCPNIKQQLEEATAKDVVTVPTFGFDCDETEGAEPLFSAQISMGDRYPDVKTYFETSGEQAAAWAISTNAGEANILETINPEYYNLRFWQSGFGKGVEAFCPGCPTTELEYLAAEFGPKLQQKLATKLVEEPAINAINMSWNPELGPQAALQASGKAAGIQSIGGLGVASDTDAVSSTDSLKAVIGQPLIWWGFAAADTMNSLFNGDEPRDEGLGWQLFTKEQNLPEKGQPFTGPVDYEAAYEKSWGG